MKKKINSYFAIVSQSTKYDVIQVAPSGQVHIYRRKESAFKEALRGESVISVDIKVKKLVKRGR